MGAHGKLHTVDLAQDLEGKDLVRVSFRRITYPYEPYTRECAWGATVSICDS
jgi:hypothetical protein